MKTIHIIFMIGLLIPLTQACVKQQPAPELPPNESMVIDFGDVWSQAGDTINHPGTNYLYAASQVYIWNLVVTIQMAIPVAAFLEAFKHQATWDRNTRSWLWAYSMIINFSSYQAELYGKINGSSIDWKMYLSKTGGYTDFLWFTGNSKINNSKVTWAINKDPEDPKLFLDIVWNNNTDGSADITYTNIQEGSADQGSYITYGTINDSDLDGFYDIFSSKDNNLVQIKWNLTLHQGRVSSEKFFNDDDWHCWNEILEDIICQ